MNNNYSESSGLDLSIVFWVVLAIAIFTAAYFLYHKIKRDLLLKRQVKLTKDWVMLKVIVPKETHTNEDDQRKNFQEMLSVIEPFYASINSLFSHSVTDKIVGSQHHISLEMIAKENKIYFYIGCPRKILQIVEKNLHAQYPHANVEVSTDYSIFEGENRHLAIYNLGLTKKHFFPIRTYKNSEEDSLNAITNSLSKLAVDETAGIQILMSPSDGGWRIASEKIANDIKIGKLGSYYTGSKGARYSQTFFKFLGDAAKTVQGKQEEEEKTYDPKKHQLNPMQESQMKLLGEKASKLGFNVQIRIVATSKDQMQADATAKNIAASFQQFNMPDGNGFFLKRAKRKAEESVNYALRLFGRGFKYILNTEELASIYHMPNRFVDTPNIDWLLAKRAAPPSNLPKEGTEIGKSVYRGEESPVKIKEEDRMRHIYMIGKTGVGKTVLFENMILQDIKAGKGVCYLDPNGDAAEHILNRIPKERAEDVVYFDPSDIERPMGLNMLEWKNPDQKDFLVQEAIQMFYKLFDPGQTGIVGPQFEHWLRNAALTLMEQPGGGTIIDIPRLFTDKEFEKQAVKNLTDPVVKAFWEKQMAKTSDFHKSEMLNYFTSKFGRFMTNDMMRNIIGQNKSAFDFRDIMDNNKILICNLSKGKIGEINAFLLGMIIVSKIAMGAFSRQDIEENKRTPFFLYVDEFQNFITDVFATILSESRKYKLSLNITNQYISQLDEKTRDAVIGNAGTLISFRIGAADAEFLVKEFEPLKLDDMTTIDKYNFYTKMLIDGAPTRPFNAKSNAPDDNPNEKVGEAIRKLSRLKYGKDRNVVSKEILDRSQVDKIDLPGIGDGNAKGPKG